MASRKELIEEFLNVQKTYRELEYSLYKRYVVIVQRLKNNNDVEGLHKYLDECPDCSSKLMFYQAIRELDDQNNKGEQEKLDYWERRKIVEEQRAMDGDCSILGNPSY